jgi:hypothetical protein
MDVGDDRHVDGADDLAQGRGRFLVRAGDADDIGSGLGAGLDLGNGGLGVRGERVGHRLHRDRRIAANLYRANQDLAALAAVDVAPGADGVDGHKTLLGDRAWPEK